jgi:hypothetical protein
MQPGAMQVLGELKARGVKVAVGSCSTNAPLERLEGGMLRPEVDSAPRTYNAPSPKSRRLTYAESHPPLRRAGESRKTCGQTAYND